MALIKMPDNGQSFEMDDAVAGDDNILKQALRSIYPEIGDATITRKTEDGQLVVTVVKQAGRKGAATEEDVVAVPDSKTKSLPVGVVRTDGGTQTRALVDRDVAADYAALMKEGALFPPVTVFFDGAEYWLADGFHRLMAATMSDQETIEAEVRQGTRRDAVLHSVGANARHGLHRTNADKRRGVETLLKDEEWSEWSDHRLARLAGVSHTFVSVLRKELSGNGLRMPTERKVERGGTTYTLTPAAPEPKSEPEPEEEKLSFDGARKVEGAEETIKGEPEEGLQEQPADLPPVSTASKAEPKYTAQGRDAVHAGRRSRRQEGARDGQRRRLFSARGDTSARRLR
jgi:hypothetical protein